MLYFLFSFTIWFLLEPIIINFIYLSNVDFFNDIILTKKNKEKLKNAIEQDINPKDYYTEIINLYLSYKLYYFLRFFVT